MNTKRLIITLFAVILSFGANAQLLETTAKMSLSRDSVMIGDTVSLYIDIAKDMSEEISIPTFKENKLTKLIEIIGDRYIDTVSVKGREVNMRLTYTITSFDAGGYVLDSFPILKGLSEPFDTLYARGNDIMNVGTFEIDTTKDNPIDIKPLLQAPYSWAEFKADLTNNWHWILAIFIALGAGALGVIWYLKHRAKVIERAKPLPPHIVALSALDRIHHEKLWQDGKIKEYYSDITDTLRTYLEGRYNIGAMEMTSAEILLSLKVEQTNPKLMTSMKNLFETADLAKFAKAVPDAEDCETAYFDAYYFVEQTKIEVIEETEDKKEEEQISDEK